jgi:hypothetical protein
MTNNLCYATPELEEYGSFRQLTHGKGGTGGKAFGINDLASVMNQQNPGCNPHPGSGTPAGCPVS